jgi:hypothetical protein
MEGSWEHGNEPGKFLCGCRIGGFSRRAQLQEWVSYTKICRHYIFSVKIAQGQLRLVFLRVSRLCAAKYISDRNIFRTEVTDTLPPRAFYDFRGNVSPHDSRIIGPYLMRFYFVGCYSSRTGDKSNAYRIYVGKPEGWRPLGRPRRTWVDNIKMDLLTASFRHAISYSIVICPKSVIQ